MALVDLSQKKQTTAAGADLNQLWMYACASASLHVGKKRNDGRQGRPSIRIPAGRTARLSRLKFCILGKKTKPRANCRDAPIFSARLRRVTVWHSDLRADESAACQVWRLTGPKTDPWVFLGNLSIPDTLSCLPSNCHRNAMVVIPSTRLYTPLPHCVTSSPFCESWLSSQAQLTETRLQASSLFENGSMDKRILTGVIRRARQNKRV